MSTPTLIDLVEQGQISTAVSDEAIGAVALILICLAVVAGYRLLSWFASWLAFSGRS